MKWSFPSNNNGDINGISNSGVETFQGTPLKSLAREICQNSLDAAANANTVVEIEFKPFTLEIDEFPDASSLCKAFTSSLDFWSRQSSKKARDFFERAIKVMDIGSIPFLRISDFNTPGLLGSKSEYNSPWCNLTKSSGASDKSGTSGGSFGIGKFAPFACSDFRTVFYSTLDSDGVEAFQGVSRITSFRREDNEITVGVGYYGADNNMPVYKQLNLDASFSRTEKQTGTDIYISGFKYYSDDWKTDIITSIIDGFLYAVFKGSMIVTVDDVVISRSTLPELIQEYQTAFTEQAENYFTVLTDKETKWYETDFKNYGKISLGLIIKPEMHRKVAMIRKTGMKIMDRGSISGIIPFAGAMLIEGEKINDFLRSIENPQHTKWEPERAANRGHAKIFIRDLINYIKDCLEELKQDDATEEIDPSVGEYLPDEENFDQTSDIQEAESLPDTIKSFEVNIPKKKPAQENSFQLGHDREKEDDTGDITGEADTSGSGHNNGKNSVGGNGGGIKEGEGKGDNPREIRKVLTGIDAVKIRIVCLNKKAGQYSVTFVPAVSAENCEIELFLSAETQNYEAPILSVKGFDQPSVTTNGNTISGLTFASGKPVRLIINVDFYDYCSMEVKAYGYKI